MKRVVYISWMPLTEKVERDWYISHLVQNGVSVEYWDVTQLLFPEIKFQKSLERSYISMISDYQQLETLLNSRDIPQTNFVILIQHEGRFYRLYKILTRFACKLFFFSWGYAPTKDYIGLFERLVKLFIHPVMAMTSYKNKLMGEFTKRLGLVKQFDVVFAAGTAARAIYPLAGCCIGINFCDYDNYILAKEKPRVVEVPYVLFLDIYLPFQVDAKILGWKTVEAGQYATSLNRFFRMVEERFGVKVVIAAHPKADYDESYFEGRIMLKGITPELVKDAKFVISHHSASVSYAVLNHKPILFIYTDEMECIYRDTVVSWVCDLAEYLGQPLINIDEVASVDQITINEPDSSRYDLYKYSYLTSKESEGRLNRDIVLAELTA